MVLKHCTYIVLFSCSFQPKVCTQHSPVQRMCEPTKMLKFVKTQSFKRSLSYKSSAPSVLVEKNGPICTIILNRPDFKNAIDLECAELLAKTVKDFDEDKNILAGVLCGIGGFCAGADLKSIASGTFNRLEDDGNAPLGPSRFELSKPMIAAVSGFAVAGGMELALWCDMRVMEEDATFGVFCRRWGVPLIDGGSVRLPRLIGLSRAMDLILTGRAVDSKEAFNIGLANRVVPKGCARKVAEEIAMQIAQFPQECMLADRKSAYHQHDLSLQDALKQEFAGGKPIAQHKLLDGINKFLKKEHKSQ